MVDENKETVTETQQIKKFWSSNLLVKVMEYEFSTPKIIQADTYKEAYSIIREWASTYYGEGEETFDKDTFSFNGGCPMVEFTAPVKITEELWKRMAMERSLLKKSRVVS